MFQIAITVGGAILALSRDCGHPPAWAWMATGVILLATGLSMYKINSGIDNNGKVLYEIGKSIGDNNLPTPENNYKSIAWWISAVMSILGVILVIAGLRAL